MNWKRFQAKKNLIFKNLANSKILGLNQIFKKFKIILQVLKIFCSGKKKFLKLTWKRFYAKKILENFQKFGLVQKYGT